MAILVVLAGCRSILGFEEPITATGDADVADGSVDIPDGPPGACTVAIKPPGVDRGRVGSLGGSINFPPLICDPGQQIVGLAVRMSDQNTSNGGRSAHGLQIACAAVTLDDSGAGATGPITAHEITGAGLNGWTPSTLGAVTLCRPGWVVSGLLGHTGQSQALFVDLTMTCAQITASGVAGSTEKIFVADSLTDTNNPTSVICSPGEAVLQMPNRSGSGIDAVDLVCGPTSCP